MSGYKPYPKYKESDVEWLGEVPEHWSHKIIKHVCTFSGGATPSTENDAYWNGDIPWVTSKDMKSEYIVDSEDHISQVGLDSCASSLIPINTIIICARSGILKHTIPIAINSVPVCLNQDLRALQFDPQVVIPKFILRWVQGLQEELLFAWRKQGATVESLEHDYIAKQSIYFPSLSEQKSIGTFLDRETSKLDILIREQKELITLLQEKRQALISNAVSKGLNPKAKMKDSGVEWLGEVPEHWEVKRLKQVAHVRGGVAKGRDLAGQQIVLVPYLRVANVQDGYLNLDDVAEIEIGIDEQERYELKAGDVLMNEGGDFDKLGRGCVWDGQISPCVHQNHVFSVRPMSISSKWLAAYTSSTQAKFYFMSVAKQSTNLASMSSSNLQELVVCRPSEKEQEAIVHFLDRETRKLDQLIQEAEETIDLMYEHRASLISEAVTGKIDLRKQA